MSNVNITEVHLLNAPLENDYKITLYFDGDTTAARKKAQTDYFLARSIHTFDNCSYQRKDQVFRAYKHIDELYNCNYVMYKNSAYSERWFYAFITDLKYVDDGRTDIYIETDVMQTWMFDYTVKPSFIEREHCNDDTTGNNTVPEGLETGEYIVNEKIDYKALTYPRCYILATTLFLEDETALNDEKLGFPNANVGIYNGILSGVRYYKIETSSALEVLLYMIDKRGQGEGVSCIFTAPDELVDLAEGEEGSDIGNVVVNGDVLAKSVNIYSMTAKTKKWSEALYKHEGNAVYQRQEQITKPSTVNGYTPLNNKVLTYPYNYVLMSNNSGGSAIYKYERFDSDVCDFEISYAITPGGSLRIDPLDYNGADKNLEEGLTGAKFPICSWQSDIYTNWLTQNSLNMQVQATSAVISPFMSAGVGAIAGGAVGGFAGSVVGGATSMLTSMVSSSEKIAGMIGERYAKSLQPPQSMGNLNNGDVTYSNYELTYTAYQMSIKEEYAKIIDEYFSCFGYKTNRVKVPNKDHRKHFWYTKTIDVNMDGAIPQADLQKIKNCYNNGITFWRNDGTIGNYSATVLKENAI